MVLAKSPDSIRLGAVVSAMEQSLEVIECGAKGGCALQPTCLVKCALTDAVKSFIESLDKHTIADMIAAPRMKFAATA